jgi:predicted ATPase
MPLLLAIADAPEHEVRAELTHLQTAEFLYETRLFPDLEYTFKHALTHEVAYQGLLHERQRALHARITEAIERLSTERVAEQAERLAHHALRGELWEKAVAISAKRGSGPWRGQPIARRLPTWSRPSGLSAVSPRPGRRAS